MSVQNRNGLYFDDIWDSDRDGKLDFHEESYMNYMEQERIREEEEQRLREEEMWLSLKRDDSDEYDSDSCSGEL